MSKGDKIESNLKNFNYTFTYLFLHNYKLLFTQ